MARCVRRAGKSITHMPRRRHHVTMHGLMCLVIIRHKSVWKAVLVAVFFLCPVADILATVAPSGVKFCMMVKLSLEKIFSPLEAVPKGPQIRNFGPSFCPFDREYPGNVKSQRCMSIRANISSRRVFQKCRLSHRAVAPSTPGSAPPYEGFVSC